jgi:hypothetical protein
MNTSLPSFVLGRSWGQTDDALHEVNLVDFHSDQLRDTPAERASTFDQRAKPKIGAIDQGPVLAVFKEAFADVVSLR